MIRRLSLVVTLLATLLPATGVCAAELYKPDPNYTPRRDLSRFFAKIKAGRPVVVMGIGGSVTEGHSWAAMSAEGLQKQYPGKQIFYVDGAYGGTPPWQTVFRMRRDILPHKPDLVFIEYAVNSYVRNFLLATGLPRGDHVLKLTLLPKSEKSEANAVRIGGFCVTNPKP